MQFSDEKGIFKNSLNTNILIRKLEIAVFNLASAIQAHIGGADRIELCVNQHLGGTSPSPELVLQVIQNIPLPVNLMVRPRGGSFCYTAVEFDSMRNEIQQFKSLPINGLVFGILTEQKTVNTEQCKELVRLAHPLPCTFHRAFDDCANPFEELQKLIDCGFSHLLTSGTKKTAEEGIMVLKNLIEKANNKIIIMPGGGVRSTNLKKLQQVTNAREFHSSALLQTEIADSNEIKLLKQYLHE